MPQTIQGRACFDERPTQSVAVDVGKALEPGGAVGTLDLVPPAPGEWRVTGVARLWLRDALYGSGWSRATDVHVP